MEYVKVIDPKTKNPCGPIRKVMQIVDHKPIDGAIEPKCVAILDNGRWEFVWNLIEFEFKNGEFIKKE